jgi:chemotaxis signal transduction protein
MSGVTRSALESIAIEETTAFPGVPNFYRGLISHRGVIYPLVDIRALIGEPVATRAPQAYAILHLSEAAAVAILADEVEAYVRIDAASIVSKARGDGGEPVAAIRGVTPDGIVVLDIALLVADARLVLDDRSLRG